MEAGQSSNATGRPEQAALAEDARAASVPAQGGASAPLAAGYVDEASPLTREYLDIIAEFGGDETGRRAAWRRMGEGTAWYHGAPVALN